MWDLVETYVEVVRARHLRVRRGGRRPTVELQTWIATVVGRREHRRQRPRAARGWPAARRWSGCSRASLYRVTIHGVSRLNSTSNPALTFVANFPHCLQRTGHPGARAPRIGTRTLLTYLPNTADDRRRRSRFYFTFAFSTPYEPFIPLGGVDDEPVLPGRSRGQRNRALIDLRNGLAGFISDYQPDAAQRFQWPLNIET